MTEAAVAAALRTLDANLTTFGARYPGDTTGLTTRSSPRFPSRTCRPGG
ncbi:hypothetical protein [Phytohabitans kaempferiae]|uniref:Uncharacterized protein n=1 Tax=Phytohabitans kaempferiae TaxID=1620943 RepID=A0ABV6MAN6_9ACTN